MFNLNEPQKDPATCLKRYRECFERPRSAQAWRSFPPTIVHGGSAHKDSAMSKSSRAIRHAAQSDTKLAGEHGRLLQRDADLIGSASQRFATACVSTLKDKVSAFVREQARPVVVIHKFHRAGFELLKFIIQNQRYALRFGGEGGIRTPDRLAPMPHFECGAFDHSATSPVPKRRFPAGSRASSMRGRPPRQALTGFSRSGMPGSAIPWGYGADDLHPLPPQSGISETCPSLSSSLWDCAW